MDYRDIPGWFNFEDIYDEAVARAKDGDHFVEVGCYLGRSTSYLAQRIKESGKNIPFDAIDSFTERDEAHNALIQQYGQGDLYEACCGLLKAAGVGRHVRVIPEPSPGAASRYVDGSLAFVWIDASHLKPAVLADLTAFYPKVSPGGWIGGHDYWERPDSFPGYSEVRSAVDEFFRIPAGSLAASQTSWLYHKPS